MTTIATSGNHNRNNSKPRGSSLPEASTEQEKGKAEHENSIIQTAIDILEQRARYGEALSSPKAAANFCRLKLGGLEHEVFGVLMLDAQNRLIEYQECLGGP